MKMIHAAASAAAALALTIGLPAVAQTTSKTEVSHDTGMKNGVRFIQYGIEVVRAKLEGAPLPLPLASVPNTS